MYDFIRAIMGGIMVGIGCIAYLSVENAVVGAMLFSIGLLSILFFDLNLFTGKIGYVIKNKKVFRVFIIGLGNLVGTLILSLCVGITSLSIKEKALKLAIHKSGDNLLSLFMLGVFCGILMFIAVDSFLNTKNIVITIFCVSVFILCGFEHSVADSFYFFLSGLNVKSYALPLLVIFLGNSVGAILFHVVIKCEKIRGFLRMKFVRES